MVMRVAGLATGMDIEAMVNKLMEAERLPLQRLKQDQTKLEWKRDAFRDINRVLLQFNDLMLDMKLSRTYQSKKVTSSKSNAVTATATTGSLEGSYSINVTGLASSAMNVSRENIDLDEVYTGSSEIRFKTFDEETNALKEHVIEVDEGDTIRDILKKINDGDNHVRAFIDHERNRVILETTRTGVYNENGPEMVFDNDDFFTNVLGLDESEEIAAKNAEFTYNNGLVLTSRTNSYELNGINLRFHDVTNGNATITVSHDVDHAFDSIMNFVDQYNKVVDAINTSQQEQVYRDYHPLSEEQKEEMSEKQIELWEEKAKSGILRGEGVLRNGLFNLRQIWYTSVDTGGEINSILDLGIETSNDYSNGGKLLVDEEKLRAALETDMESVQKLFAAVGEESNGLVYQIEENVKQIMRGIEERAGKEFHTLENYQIGKRIKQLDDQISAFEQKLYQVENRYWNQFTRMEVAIQRLNEQSSYLFSQFYGG